MHCAATWFIGRVAVQGDAILCADIMVLRTAHVLSSLESGLSSKTPATRSGAFLLLTAISEICKSAVEPYLIPLVPSILNGAADKAAEVHMAALRAGRATVHNMCPYGARFVLPKITEAMASTARWQQKNAACVLLNDILTHAPSASAPSLPEFFPPLRDLMTDAREEVREAALAAMQVALTLVNNRDLEPLLPVREYHLLRCCIAASQNHMHARATHPLLHPLWDCASTA